jgi:myo-inositol-1-phosphate synthase
MIEESPAESVDVTQVLRDTRAQVFVSYLPVGSEDAQRYYAQCALDAGVAFVNAIPVFIASDPVWAKKFTDAGVPIIGDDIKSQVGATIVHRVLARLFEDRGLTLDHTYQLNVGGNMDFKNMLERERLESKKISKTQAVTSQLEISNMDPDDVHIGPSDHVPWLKDRKWAYIRMEGRNFGDVPLNVELKLEVWDSPNSAGVIIDAVRCAKVALDRGIGGPIIGPSAYFMKSPPIQFHDDVAHDMVEAFADRGAENIVWPSPDAIADVEAEAEAVITAPVVATPLVSSTPATPGSSDTLFTRG